MVYDIINSAVTRKLRLFMGKEAKQRERGKCRQFIVLPLRYSKYPDVLDGVGQRGKPTFFPPLLGGEKEGGGKWRFVFKKKKINLVFICVL